MTLSSVTGRTSVVPRLSVTDALGQRTVSIDVLPFGIGRRTTANLQVVSRDVSRAHAEIACTDGVYWLRDAGSRFGTFLNGEQVSEPRALSHGDRIRLGQSEEVELIFLSNPAEATVLLETGGGSDLRQLAAILDGLRALGSGRVLDEVLTLVLDSALDVTTAERGCIMLADESGDLAMTVARGRGRRTLPATTFATSTKIPREVFATGRSRIVSDLLDADLAPVHQGTVAAGIRHVLCVPLKVAPFGSAAREPLAPRVIGVLYLDGRERSTLLSSQVLSSLDAFATQAALAIDSARLYAEAAEKARLERDLRIAAEIQQRLLPEPRFRGPTFDLAATSIPCRTIGGDFFDYLDTAPDCFGFALGDVSGKGPPAALLAATVQANFAAQAPLAADPAATMAGLNRALLKRAVEARFATMFFATLAADGQLAYSNAGQEPPMVVREGGAIEALEIGGPVLGLLDFAAYDTGHVRLNPGDLVVVYSDGVSEARNAAEDEFGRDRLAAVLSGRHGADPDQVLADLVAAVGAFAGAAPQADDLTALVLRYRS